MANILVSLNESACASDEKLLLDYGVIDENFHLQNFSLYRADYNNPEKPIDNFLFNCSKLLGTCDRLFIGSSVFLYPTTWTRSFLSKCASCLNETGSLVFRQYLVDNSIVFNGLSANDLQSIYPVEFWQQSTGHAYTNSEMVDEKFSLCEWYSNRGLAFGLKSSGRLDEHSIGKIEVSYPNEPKKIHDVTLPKLTEGYDETVEHADFYWIEYLSLGTAYKVAFLKHIISKYLGRSHGISLVDHGSGSGVVPIQLLHEDGLDFEQVVALDPVEDCLDLTCDALNHLDEGTRNKFEIIITDSESYEYSSKFDVISFIHMLLLIEAPKRKDVIAKAWEALKPGGLLIFLEIPKHDSSLSYDYYDQMLTGDDILELFSFSKMTAFEQKFIKEIDAVDAKELPVFRFLKKPEAL